MTLKSIPNTMELNIPSTTPYSVNIEKTQDNQIESKYYMLSKHHNNKTSIIDDVVSKIPTVITLPSPSSKGAREPCNSKINYPTSNTTRSIKCATLPKLLKISNKNASSNGLHESNSKTVIHNTTFKQQTPILHENSIDDEYFSECENCKTAQSTNNWIGSGTLRNEMETMTLHRRPTKIENQSDQQFRVSSTLPSNPRKIM